MRSVFVLLCMCSLLLGLDFTPQQTNRLTEIQRLITQFRQKNPHFNSLNDQTIILRMPMLNEDDRNLFTDYGVHMHSLEVDKKYKPTAEERMQIYNEVALKIEKKRNSNTQMYEYVTDEAMMQFIRVKRNEKEIFLSQKAIVVVEKRREKEEQERVARLKKAKEEEAQRKKEKEQLEKEKIALQKRKAFNENYIVETDSIRYILSGSVYQYGLKAGLISPEMTNIEKQLFSNNKDTLAYIQKIFYEEFQKINGKIFYFDLPFMFRNYIDYYDKVDWLGPIKDMVNNYDVKTGETWLYLDKAVIKTLKDKGLVLNSSYATVRNNKETNDKNIAKRKAEERKIDSVNTHYSNTLKKIQNEWHRKYPKKSSIIKLSEYEGRDVYGNKQSVLFNKPYKWCFVSSHPTFLKLNRNKGLYNPDEYTSQELKKFVSDYSAYQKEYDDYVWSKMRASGVKTVDKHRFEYTKVNGVTHRLYIKIPVNIALALEQHLKMIAKNNDREFSVICDEELMLKHISQEAKARYLALDGWDREDFLNDFKSQHFQLFKDVDYREKVTRVYLFRQLDYVENGFNVSNCSIGVYYGPLTGSVIDMREIARIKL